MPDLDLKLSQASGVPFYRQVVDQIAALIQSGRLVPGALLPSARDLAVTLMVSLITTRRAYADLEAMGLVVRRQGQGTYVADAVDADAAREFRQNAADRLMEAIRGAQRAGFSAPEILRFVQQTLATSEGSPS